MKKEHEEKQIKFNNYMHCEIQEIKKERYHRIQPNRFPLINTVSHFCSRIVQRYVTVLTSASIQTRSIQYKSNEKRCNLILITK